MVRLFPRLIWFALLIAAPPLCIGAEPSSEPDACQGLNAQSSCDDRDACVDARFKSVMEKDPDKACAKSAKAGWDAIVAKKLEKDGDTYCESSVCKGTYNRLKKAVTDYKSAMREACQARNNFKSCGAVDQASAPACMKQVTDANAKINERARQALLSALDESKTYKALIQEVNKSYAADMTKINQTEKLLKSSGVDQSKIAAEKNIASSSTGSGFTSEASLLSQISGSSVVEARNGGAKTIAEYQRSTNALVQEQNTAAATIDAFENAAATEMRGRNLVAVSLSMNAKLDATNASGQGSSGSTVTGGNNSGSSKLNPAPSGNSGPGASAVPGASSSGNSGGSGSEDNSLLNQATSLTKLAGAGAGLASAAVGSMSGASSPSTATQAGLGGTGGMAATPTASQATNPLSSALGGGRGSAVGALGSGASDGSVKAPSRSGQVDRSNIDGSAGGVRSGLDGGSFSASSATGRSSSGVSGSGTYISARASASGASGGDVSIKESGRDPAGCASSDCGVMGELKTEQFNSVGALGVPKIGAADPALSTKGALDNLFGPMPALDSLVPKDAAGAAPALEGMLAKMDSAVGEAQLTGSDAQASAAAVEPANSRSLFERVHAVHEVALKRGAVALFHRKL